MTRYSGSRGLMYTAPPAADEETEDLPAEAEASEPTAADD